MGGLLDFLYLAQLPSQMADMISYLKCSLLMFHENMDIFMDLGIWDHFNVPKIHSLLYYSSSICLFGTADNYNTEQTEWLHIDFVKNAYCLTNHKDKYPQITMWLECCEKVQQLAICIKSQQQQQHFPASALYQRAISMSPQPGMCYLKMTQHLTIWRVSFEDIIYNYGAIIPSCSTTTTTSSEEPAYPGLFTSSFNAVWPGLCLGHPFLSSSSSKSLHSRRTWCPCWCGFLQYLSGPWYGPQGLFVCGSYLLCTPTTVC